MGYGDERKMRVLQIHNYYQIPGGEDTVVMNERKLLEAHGHTVIQYSRNNSEIRKLSKLKKILLPFTTIFNPKTYCDIKKIIKMEKIDVVHVHNTLNLISPAVYYAAVFCKVPVLQTIHNFRLLCPGATFYRDGIICEDCVTSGLTCAVKHGCYRGSKAQTLVCVVSTWIHRMTGIYGKLNYVCLTDFTKEKLLTLKQINADQVYVKPNFTYDMHIQKKISDYYLFIGRIEEIKGIKILIEAFSQMPEKKLHIAGTGTELEKYRSLMEEKGYTNIRFLGFQESGALAKLLEGAKAVIVASQWYETFGLIVVEAFSARTPVIVGDIGNVAGLVDHSVNGLKFQYNDSEKLKEAVCKFEYLDNAAMGENAYSKFKMYFSPEENYQKLMEMYSVIIHNAGECIDSKRK